MVQTSQRQTQVKARRGCDFVLEGVPMYESPDISSDSSDDDLARTATSLCGQGAAPTAYFRPPVPNEAPTAPGDLPTERYHQEKQQHLDQQQQHELARQQILLEQRRFEQQQQQATLLLRQQEVARTGQQKEQQQTQKQLHLSQQSVPSHRELQDVSWSSVTNTGPIGSLQCSAPANDMDYVKYFCREGHGDAGCLPSILGSNLRATVVPRTSGGSDTQFSTPLHSRGDTQHFECIGDCSSSSMIGNYMLDETVYVNALEAERRKNGGGENAGCGAQVPQVDGMRACKFESTLYLSDDRSSTRISNGHAMDMESTSLFTLTKHREADKGAVTGNKHCAGGAVGQRWMSANSNVLNFQTPVPAGATRQRGSVTVCDTTSGDMFSRDYEFIPVDLRSFDGRNHHSIRLPAEVGPPLTPPSCKESLRGCGTHASLSSGDQRGTLQFDLQQQWQHHQRQQQSDRHVSHGGSQNSSEHPPSLGTPGEYPCIINHYLHDPKGVSEAKSNKVGPPAFSVETTDKLERARTWKVINSNNPRRWILMS